MRQTLLRIALLLSLPLFAAFCVFMVNQTAQLVALADRFHPVAGQVALWGLLGLYLVCVAVPALLFLRMPAPLVPPDRDDGPEFARHLEQLAARLRANPRLHGRRIDSREEVEEALAHLDREAEELVRAAGGRVFMTTAISQNGSLDGVLVFAAQSRLVLQIARTYNQRPSARDLAFLYANVASATFVTAEIDDLDLAAQVQPIIGSVLGSAAGAVPGLQVASSLVVNSVMNGAANAFLTLRVGLIAQQYSRSLVRPQRSVIRRAAILRATQMLGAITIAGAGRISAAVWQASMEKVGGVVSGMGNQIKSTGSGLVQKMRFGKKPVETE